MLQQATINIDRILEELDVLARSSNSDDDFFKRLLLQLGATIGAASNAIAIPALEDRWLVRSSVGTIDACLMESVRDACLGVTELSASGTQFTGTASASIWYAVPISSVSLAKGLLISVYPNVLSDAERMGLAEIQRAFCELVNERQSIAIERFFAQDMAAIRQMGRCLETNDSTLAAAQTLVNGLASIVPSCRISLSEVDAFGVCHPISVSAVSQVDPRTPAYRDIQSLAQIAAKQKAGYVCRTAIESKQGDTDQSMAVCDTLFLPFGEQNQGTRWILGFEFRDHAAYVQGCSKLPYVLPVIETIWKQKETWLDIPSWIRRIPFKTSSLRSSVAKRIKTALLVVLISAFGLWMLKSTTLLIEAEGTLLPSQSKAIFAAADGFISTLLVTDNQTVEAGQLLVTMTSPDLDLQLEELRGKIRSFEEESRGIEIAMNQLQPNTDDLLKQQSLMASKLKDIAIQIESLQKQKSIVESQRETLEIRSPINGIAIGKDLQQNLLGRPVNRGELLFRVMDVASEWELRLNVSDLDSHYVRKEFSDHLSKDSPSIEYVLDSSPKDRHTASIKSIANRVENIHREGNFLEVRAQILELSMENKKVGSNVHAYFPCGKHPTWFVWFRPAIEAARRKLWF